MPPQIFPARFIEWFGLEGTLKIIWFQLPCHEQGHLPLDQVAQSPIQDSQSLQGISRPCRFPHCLLDVFSAEVWERKAADPIQHPKGSPALKDTGQTGPGGGKVSWLLRKSCQDKHRPCLWERLSELVLERQHRPAPCHVKATQATGKRELYLLTYPTQLMMATQEKPSLA